MKYLKLLPLLFMIAVLLSCSKKDDDTNNNNDNPGVLGAVGNEWSAKFNNNQDIFAKIIANDNGFISIEINLDGEKDTIYLHFKDNIVSEFIHSNGDLSKPFTIVEFDAKVGDFYTFNMEELYFYRDVIEIETYYITALGKEIETIGVYEEIPYGIDFQLFGITIRSITWYWHPDYGLVCVEIYTDQGDYIEIVFVQINL